MQADAPGWDPWSMQRTAAMRLYDGGFEVRWEVARRTARRMEEVLRLVENVVLIKDALSLRKPMKILSVVGRPIDSNSEGNGERKDLKRHK